jgi:hypothetical protein
MTSASRDGQALERREWLASLETLQVDGNPFSDSSHAVTALASVACKRRMMCTVSEFRKTCSEGTADRPRSPQGGGAGFW